MANARTTTENEDKHPTTSNKQVCPHVPKDTTAIKVMLPRLSMLDSPLDLCKSVNGQIAVWDHHLDFAGLNLDQPSQNIPDEIEIKVIVGCRSHCSFAWWTDAG